MVFVEAAVRRLLKEQALRDAVQTPELLKLFEFYSNKYRRDSLNRPRPSNLNNHLRIE
jgi:hypothetical protein